jgi:hypothetical protein
VQLNRSVQNPDQPSFLRQPFEGGPNLYSRLHEEPQLHLKEAERVGYGFDLKVDALLLLKYEAKIQNKKQHKFYEKSRVRWWASLDRTADPCLQNNKVK